MKEDTAEFLAALLLKDNLLDALPTQWPSLYKILLFYLIHHQLTLLANSQTSLLSKPELLFHTQFLWSHQAVCVVTPLDFTFLLPHSFKSALDCRKWERFSLTASVLSGIYCRLSCRGEMCGSFTASSVSLWFLFTEDDILKEKESLPPRRLLLQPWNDRELCHHPHSLRGGEEWKRKLFQTEVHVSFWDVSGRSVWRLSPIIQHKQIQNWQEEMSNVSFGCVFQSSAPFDLLSATALWAWCKAFLPTGGL